MNSENGLKTPAFSKSEKNFPKFRTELLGINADFILLAAEKDRDRLPESTARKYVESAQQRVRWALSGAMRGGWTREQLVEYLSVCEPEKMAAGKQKP